MMARVRSVIAAAMRGRVDVVGLRVDVHEHRRGPPAGDRPGRGEEGVRGRDHLVARPDPEGHQRDQQRVGARRDADAVGALAVGGDLPLQGLDLRAEDEDLASRTRSIAARTSSRIVAYWAFRLSSGTGVDCLVVVAIIAIILPEALGDAFDPRIEVGSAG